MKICSKCGKTLGENEMICPDCFADAIDKSDTSTAENITKTEVTASDEAAAIVQEEAEIPTSSDDICCENDIPDVSADSGSENPDPSDELLHSASGGIRKLILFLAIIAIAGAVAGILIPLARLRSESDLSNQKAYINYLAGTWTSDAFIYADGENPSRELLTIKKDMTYKSIIVTSPDSSDEYNSATWTVTDKSEGSYTIDAENAVINISCTVNGQVYSFPRYVRKLSTDCLVLREYYNEQLTDYFDVSFTKGK